MKHAIHEIKNPFTTALMGMALVVVLGLAFALPTLSFAQNADGRRADTTIRTAGDYTASNTTTDVTPDGTVTTTSTVTVTGSTAILGNSGTFDRTATGDTITSTTDTTVTTTSGTISKGNAGLDVSRTGTGRGYLELINNADISGLNYGIRATRSRTDAFTIYNDGASALVVRNNGAITDATRDGIYAEHGRGSILVSVNADVTSSGRGIFASLPGGGFLDIEVLSGAGVTSARNEGIFANLPGGGFLDVDVFSGASVTSAGDDGIFAYFKSGYVDINVLSGGSVISRGGKGIFVDYYGSGYGPVNLNVHGRVQGYSSGISIERNGIGNNYSLGPDIFVQVHQGGSVSATNGDAIRLRYAGLQSTISVGGTVSSVGGKAIDVMAGNHFLLVLQPGFSINGEVAVATDPRYKGPTDWRLLRTILLGPYPDRVTPGDVGVLDLDAADYIGFREVVNWAGYTDNTGSTGRTWVITGEASENETFPLVEVQWGTTLRLSDASVNSDIFYLNSYKFPAVLEIAGSNRLRGNLDSEGRLVFLPKSGTENEKSSLTITGDYSGVYGWDGELIFNVNLAEQSADELIVYGDVYASLQFPARILMRVGTSGAGSPPAEESPVLIEVHDTAVAGYFVGDQTVGAFRYVLEHDAVMDAVADKSGDGIVHRWRFRKRELSRAAAPASLMAPTLLELSMTPDSSGKSFGSEQSGLGFRSDGGRHARGVWARQQGLRASLEPGGITGGRSRMEDNRIHFGYDIPEVTFMGGDMVMGASISQGFLTSEVSSPVGNGSIGIESNAAALAASWRSPEGFYADGRTRYIHFSSDVSAGELSLVRDNEGTGVGASVETGYRFAVLLGGADFQVAPHAQLTWSRVDFDDFVGPHGELVSLEDGDLVMGRLGLSWDGEWHDIGGSGRIYGGVSLRDALDGRTAVSISGFSLASEQGLSVDGRLGVSYEWDEGYAVHGEALALRRDDAEEIRANLGVSINF